MASKKTWWIEGGAAACLALVMIVLAMVGGVACGGSSDEGATDDDAVIGGNFGSDDDDDGGGQSTGETLTWTNDQSRLTGNKAANFVAFSFDYPADWQVVEDGTQPDSDSPNFVKVEKMTDDQVTIENFAVGWYAGAGASNVITMLEPQFATSFPNYEKVADQTAQVDGIASPGFLFRARVDTAGGPVQFYGRALAVPVDDSHGILVIMFASELAEGVDGPEDVGSVGQMPVILESFDIQE